MGSRLLLVALAGLTGAAVARGRRRRALPARAVIVSPPRSTAVTEAGAVRSIQSANLVMAPDDLDRLWNPTNLENLARTYWRFLSRVTLGLVRVVYGKNERSVVLLARPLTLLRFEAPEYHLDDDRGTVRWRIRDGRLVARSGRGSGFLALNLQRDEQAEQSGQCTLHIDVEVANFYPAIAASFSVPAYQATQSVVHVLVTHAFLRSLAKLDLARSKVGRFANASPAGIADEVKGLAPDAQP